VLSGRHSEIKKSRIISDDNAICRYVFCGNVGKFWTIALFSFLV
jgi:hypothetical protein